MTDDEPTHPTEEPHFQLKAKVPDEPWDLSDPLNPQPNVYPVCPTCKAPWQYTWAWLISKGEKWCWTRPAGIPRGCKHKGTPMSYDRRTGEQRPLGGP